MTHTRLTVPDDGYSRPGSYTPPPIGGEPRLYALLAVEVKPGHIVYFHVELDHTPGACTIDMEQDYEDVHSWETLAPVRAYRAGPPHITATLSGTIVSRQADYRPPARTESRVDDQAAISGRPHALESGSDR